MRLAIVDDSRISRMGPAWALRSEGFDVQEIEPSSVGEVLDALRAAPPELLLLDLHMPQCPGIDLVRAIREDPGLARLPILIVSAHWDEATKEALGPHQVQGFIPKPVHPKDIAQLVRDSLGGL